MDILEAMQARHSVRSYTETPIADDALAALREEVNACNAKSGLRIQLVTNEPAAFGGLMARYGKFSGVQNYIALVGKKGPGLDEAVGYYGQRVVLKAQMLGLNTCWVAASFSRGKAKVAVGRGEKLVCVVALGYGATQGVPHKNKPMETLCRTEGEAPGWFSRGMEAAMLAPTAMNQQRFLLTQSGTAVMAQATGGFYSKLDLGIVKYQFEQGAGSGHFTWGTP